MSQEVEQAAQSLGYDFSGVDKPRSEEGLYGLRYSQFVVPLVKSVQEQQAVIEAQAGKIEKLAAENAALKIRLDTQAAQLQQITAALQTAGLGLGNR